MVTITPRDVEILRWIHEQKFMTVEQVRKVFWNGASNDIREHYRRLRELQNAGYLRRNGEDVYSRTFYTITRGGMKQLKKYGHCQGWSELSDAECVVGLHDIAVTDLRILFHEMGYKDWISERSLQKWHEFRNLSDGVIFHRDNYFAVEYEASQKAHRRYKDILLEYELDRRLKAAIYVCESAELCARIRKIAGAYDKIHFVTFRELQLWKHDAQLNQNEGVCTLKTLLDS